jgi:hypothetical protein
METSKLGEPLSPKYRAIDDKIHEADQALRHSYFKDDAEFWIRASEYERHTYQQKQTPDSKAKDIVDVWPCAGELINKPMLERFEEELGHLGADYSPLMRGGFTTVEEHFSDEDEVNRDSESESEIDIDSNSESESENQSESDIDSNSCSDGDWDWVHHYDFELYPED